MAFVSAPLRCLRIPSSSTLRVCSLTPSVSIPYLPVSRVARNHFHTTPTAMASEGEAAPDFTRVDGEGNTVTLSSLRGKNVVLYFSNGAGPGCTSQSCSFRDSAEDFSNLNAEILAVSAQTDSAAQEFRRTNRLPFPVISDKDGSLQKSYGVPSTFGLIPGRITYVIDKNGVIRKVYNSQFSTAKHISVAKSTLASLQ